MKDVYSFTKMIEADLPLLFKWANEPHVKNWWDSEDVWDDFKIRYLANINSKDSFPFIIRLDEKPIGYINYWTDPDARNLAAIRCYQKAGFRIVRNMESAEGKIVLMERRR